MIRFLLESIVRSERLRNVESGGNDPAVIAQQLAELEAVSEGLPSYSFQRVRVPSLI